jgi:hypothetical protein
LLWVAAYTTGGLDVASDRHAPLSSPEGQPDEADETFWIGDRVVLNVGGETEDATIVDLTLADSGAVLSYSIRSECGMVRDVAPGSVQTGCLYGHTPSSEMAGLPITTEVRSWLAGRLDADRTLMHDLVRMFAERLMWAETERATGRTDYRNSYRPRVLNSHFGKIRLLFPRLRKGTYFPDWLVEHHALAENVLFPFVSEEFLAIVREGYVEGVSPKLVNSIVERLEIPNISERRQVEIARVLDEDLREYRVSRLQGHSFPIIRLDVLCRSIVQVACVIVTDARPGHHTVLDVDVIPSEGEADWLAFLRSLVERGVSGVTTVISDYHEGLEAAVPAAMPDALWLQSFSSPRTRLPA